MKSDNRIKLSEIKREWANYKRRFESVGSGTGRQEDFSLREVDECSRCQTEIPADDLLWLIQPTKGLILCPECQGPDEKRTRAVQIRGLIEARRVAINEHKRAIININSQIAELQEISAGLMG